jgi:hypothetical protein
MSVSSTPRWRGRLLGAAALLVLAAGLPLAGAAAGIAFNRSGPFEACVDAAFDTWVKAQAELMVNEDARAQSLDDAAVAAWTVAALEDCRTRTKAGDAASEDIFSRHMSRWRQHIFDLASSIRRRGQSD